MFTTITICKRPDKSHPFFFHTDLWKESAWLARVEEVKTQYPRYSEEEILSDDELTLTRINNFGSQLEAEEIINFNLTHFSHMYDRKKYSTEKGHLFIQTPQFNRQTGKFIVE